MKFFLLALIPIYFISVGLIIQPFDSIVTGIYEIIWEPDFLITDYIAVGGMGAAFVNAGMMALISIYFVYSLGMEMDGHTITSCCLMFGFSLFGKNLMNIWAIFLGVFLYAKYHKMYPQICVNENKKENIHWEWYFQPLDDSLRSKRNVTFVECKKKTNAICVLFSFYFR